MTIFNGSGHTIRLIRHTAPSRPRHLPLADRSGSCLDAPSEYSEYADSDCLNAICGCARPFDLR
jgi:hypothetical protein